MHRNQSTYNPQWPQQPPLLPEQAWPQLAQSDYLALLAVAQHPQQPLVYNPQWTVSQLPQIPLPEQGALYVNHEYGPQWQRQLEQLQYQQHQYHGPSPQLAAQLRYNPYQPIAGYLRHYVPQPVTSPQPELPYYLHLQPQQQQRLHNRPAGSYPSPLRGRGARRGLMSGNKGGMASRGQATQFQGVQGVNISGNPRFTNVGMNTGNLTTTTVNNYGSMNGLENLKEFVSFAALHNSAEQDPYRRCHSGTRESVLKRLRYWIGNTNPTDRIFWLYGPAGAGKSAIAQTIAHAYNQGEVAATFFFYRSDPGRNNGNRLFTTIAWQLAFSIPAVKDFIVHALDKIPHLPMTDVETQFEQLVAYAMNNIISQMPHLAPVVIIDGVDECSDEQLQRRFLIVIGNAIKDCRVPLRFLICSRPEAMIEETLDQFKDFTLRIDLATVDDANLDIEKYLVDQFSDIASKQGLDASWPGKDTIEEIVFKSSGNFILPSTLIRFIGDEDHSAVSQLDIIRKLKPPGMMSPFALLDELYLEILKRQLDQDFLKIFLALLVGRSSINKWDLHKDDATLMNVSEKELCIKLRRMRSLLKFEPFIDVYHKSFLDFLQDLSRSGQYHVSKQGGQKQCLKLIVDSVVQHVSMATEQPDCHETCRSSPEFKYIVVDYPPKIVLPVEDWQETLKPLLVLQDKLLKTSKSRPCRVIQVMRDLLLHLVILQRKSYCIAPTQAPDSNMNWSVTKCNTGLVTEAREYVHEKDLDGCLSVLLSCLRNPNSALMVDAAVIDHMCSLLAFDNVETAARVQSVSDAQNLIDLIDLLANNDFLLSQCGPDARRKAVHLASEILSRVPLLPQSFFSLHRGDPFQYTPRNVELVCQMALISRILDHNYIVPLYDVSHGPLFTPGNGNERNEYLGDWLKRSKPNFVTKIRVMLDVARTIQYIHSMDIALFSSRISDLQGFALDSSLRAKALPYASYTTWLNEASVYGHEEPHFQDFTHESNISAFAELFTKVCFCGRKANPRDCFVKEVKQLIKRCRAEDPQSQPTMEDVVKEMEAWNLT